MHWFTALGDSITAGEAATSPSKAYPALTATLLSQTGHPTSGHVLAEPGWTSASLAAAVLDNPPDPLAQSASVIIWVGGDDLAYAGLRLLQGAPRTVVAASLRTYALHVSVLCRYIHQVSQARIFLCTQYNPFPNSPPAVEAISALNQVTATVAHRAKAGLVPVHTWFAGREQELIAHYRTGRLEDVLTTANLPIHPNNTGHRVIAQHLAYILRQG
ncbi:MAG: SGNH/GDSL hydrolase family protein [Alicyclobacillus herbarius]|uniref:SGNH/GDSL hydrolase family protein n=1 Tax=Alicyclobacillus herbarius TaxID=122960 RepID=UPI002353CCA1|nr:SGNH/GDSL hydrolase family protein [Alicyclobacillus herbarius]MCL6632387.1 SGNH/GDSL hydrolase family protein [Alicyclobacillus herbarius]